MEPNSLVFIREYCGKPGARGRSEPNALEEFTLQSLIRQSGPPIKEVSRTPLMGHYVIHALQVPEPLLPNGLGRIGAIDMDLNMLSTLNSKERTLSKFVNLGYETMFSSKLDLIGMYNTQARPRFVKMWKVGDMDIREFAPVALN
jgi:hypothetical protein